jgi:hypothetical protein
MRFHPDGTGGEIYATGLRNAVGFDWRPEDGELYATDNGRDLLGDDFPPCELDHVVQGGFYGWPVANGNRVPDPDFGKGAEARIAASIPPVHGFRAHNAPLGITFLRGQDLPEDYRGAALVALHGSWNRTRKDGYEVVSLHWRADGAIEERDFLTGFLDRSDDEVVGRPVDVAEGPDGAVYVSDDYAGGGLPREPGAGGEDARRGGAGWPRRRTRDRREGDRRLPPRRRRAAGARALGEPEVRRLPRREEGGQGDGHAAPGRPREEVHPRDPGRVPRGAQPSDAGLRSSERGGTYRPRAIPARAAPLS